MSDTMTPSTLTVISGITDGTALKISDTITSAISNMNSYAGSIAISDPTLSTNISLAASALGIQAEKIKGNIHGHFGQALGHVTMAKDLKKSTDFMSAVKFDDLGAGIKDVSSLTDQGLSSTLGNLKAAASVVQSVGKVYNIKNISTFGTPGGLVQSLIDNKLANYSGLMKELNTRLVDTNQLADPAFAPQIILSLQSIKDTSILQTVLEQYKLSITITSLADLLDINKLAGPDLNNIQGGLSNLVSKLKDLGTNFNTSDEAANMLNNIDVPSGISTLNSTDMSTLSSSISSSVPNLVGTGTGKDNLPTLTDFMCTVSGGNIWISDLTIQPITQIMVDRCNNVINNVALLFDKAGVDLSQAVPKKLTNIVGFATNLLTYGADSEAANIITSITDTSTISGQAIIASLSEGKNRKFMSDSGIIPIKYS